MVERNVDADYTGVRARIAQYFSQWFPERELFLRGDGNLKYLRLTHRRQVTFATLALLFAAWIVGATAGLAYVGVNFFRVQSEADERRLAYLDLLSEVGAYHEEFAKIIGTMEGNQSLLLSRLAESDDGARYMEQIHSELTDIEAGKARLVLVRQALKTHIEGLEKELHTLAARDAERGARLTAALETMRQMDAEGAEVAAARERLDHELQATEGRLAQVQSKKLDVELLLASARQELEEERTRSETLASEKAAFHAELQSLYEQAAEVPRREAELRGEIGALQGDLSDATTEIAALRSQRDFFETRAEKLEDRLDEVSEIQNAIVQRLTTRTVSSIDMIEHVVEMAGLDVDDLIEGASLDNLALAQGGPYIEGDILDDYGPHRRFRSSVALLDRQLARWEALQEVFRAIPLSSPLDQYKISSGFGERLDPINGRRGMHYGLDLKAPLRAPVLAPAAGVVTFAGWKGQFVRLVEVDHGSGIRTRYAHLRKILVKRGDQIEHGQEIALLGSSGRSTGPHLHYEIQVNGQVYDPARFLMAGRNAFKN